MQTKLIPTFWGTYATDESVISRVLDHPLLTRLKSIDQSGPLTYFGHAPAYSRYDHCLGVWALLRRFGCSLKEQVCGLLHDVSHTVFSHVGDYLYTVSPHQTSYQDTIHLKCLTKAKILDVLGPDWTLNDLNPEHHPALDFPLPDLCADRLDYLLQTGVRWERITYQEALHILENLCFEESMWFFTDETSALQFANLSLYFTQELYGASWNLAIYHYIKEAIERALHVNTLTKEDIHEGVDEDILNRLRRMKDPLVTENLEKCAVARSCDNLSAMTLIPPKFRGVDPWLQTINRKMRLTECNRDFALYFYEVKTWCRSSI